MMGSYGVYHNKLLLQVFILVILNFCIDLTDGLRNLKISVPTAVVSGGSCILECKYDLEGEKLYSVKWFRGKTEFYRFVPGESPPTRTFASSGITVDLNNSTDTRVSLINMQRELSDFYRCEVVTDIPKFYTLMDSRYLVVVVPPKSRPQIQSDKWKYAYGEMVKANCTSGPAYPGVNITWFVNNEVIKETSETVTKGDFNGLVETIISSLEMEVKPNKYRLMCIANQYDVYRETSNHHDIVSESPTSAAIQKSPASKTYASISLPLLIICFIFTSQYGTIV